MRLPRFILVAAVAVLAAACSGPDEVSSQLRTAISTDGYALFAVENDRQQIDEVSVLVMDAEPGATYALLFSPENAPASIGWFELDLEGRERCGYGLGPHCQVRGGFGYLVDFVTVPDDAASITLVDERCGCDQHKKTTGWTGHWAVMRIERPEEEHQLLFHVTAKRFSELHGPTEPAIRQLH